MDIKDFDDELQALIKEINSMHSTDQRTPEHWDEQKCFCGNTGWCGRDSHRPLFAVDENNSTIYFPNDQEVN